jgi:signal transduction histidine kinase
MVEAITEKRRRSVSQSGDVPLGIHRIKFRLFDLSTEQLIDYLRCALASVAFFACFVVPPFPSEKSNLIHAILGWYFAYSVVVTFIARVWPNAPVWPFATHLIDIGIAALLMHLAEGSASPCFIFFTFTMISAALRWDWRGAIGTTLALLILFLALNARTNFSTTILHSTYLTVSGLLLAYFGGLRAYNRERLAKLVAWPTMEKSLSAVPLLKGLLAHVAEIMGAARVLVIWDVRLEGERNFLLWDKGQVECQTEVAGERIEDLLAPCLSGNNFKVLDAKSRMVMMPDGMKLCPGPPIAARLQKQFNIRQVVSAPFAHEGADCQGRVFALDCACAVQTQLSLIEIVAHRIGLELEYHFLQLETERLVATRERSKLAHDLHDGLLQNLTAATLQLNVCSTKCSAKTRQDLSSIQQLLVNEQKRLREFVDGTDLRIDNRSFALAKGCGHILADLSKYWDCEAPLNVMPADAEVPSNMAEHLSLILAEAIANAAKHGGATRVLVGLERTAGALAISINDNGCGFRGLAGTYTFEALVCEGIGPQFLRDRVADLGGELIVSTSPSGSRLQIRLPIHDLEQV